VDAERPDKKGLTTRERAARDLRVVQDRARGMSWTRIADRHEISDRQARRIVAEYRQSRPALHEHDPVEVVEETLEAYEAAIDELAILAETTDHDSTRLGAIKARLDAQQERVELLTRIGVLPRDLGQAGVEIDLREIAARLDAVLSSPGVSPALREGVITALDPRSPEPAPLALVRTNGSAPTQAHGT
jgi:hypothetical protein